MTKIKKQKQSLVPRGSKEFKELILIRKTMMQAQRMLQDAYQKALDIEANKNENDNVESIIAVKPHSPH